MEALNCVYENKDENNNKFKLDKKKEIMSTPYMRLQLKVESIRCMYRKIYKKNTHTIQWSWFECRGQNKKVLKS